MVFTPEGVYDSSDEGDRLVTHVVDEEVKPLSQFARRLFTPFLANELRQGRPPVPDRFSLPPPLLPKPGTPR